MYINLAYLLLVVVYCFDFKCFKYKLDRLMYIISSVKE